MNPVRPGVPSAGAQNTQIQRTSERRQAVDPQLVEAAEGLEAVFVDEMMKAMRKTVEPSEFSMNNSATEIYQGMLDSQYAESAAKAQNIGLSDMIVDYWSRPQYTNNRVSQRSEPKEGVVNDESQSIPNTSNSGK